LQDAEREGRVALDGGNRPFEVDIIGGQFGEQPEALDPAGVEHVGGNQVRAAENVALEQLESEVERGRQLRLGLQALGDKLHLGMLAAPIDGELHFVHVGVEHVDLGVARVPQERFPLLSDDELVYGDGVTLFGEVGDACEYRVIDLDVGEDFQSGLARVERQRQIADQKLPGEVDEAGAVADQLLDAELGERGHDDLAGGVAAPGGRL
jgi:hypothetical protein